MEQYHTQPLRCIVETPFKTIMPKTYGVMLFSKDSRKWLMIRRKHTFQYTNILRSRCRISEIPGNIKCLTEDEICNLEKMIEETRDSRPDIIHPSYESLIIDVFHQRIKGMSSSWTFIYHSLPLIDRCIRAIRSDSEYKYPQLAYLWAKGFQNNDSEKPIVSAIRELVEESGLFSLPDDTVILPWTVEYCISRPHTQHVTQCWVCVVSTEIDLPKVDDKNIEVSDRTWMSTEECLSCLLPEQRDALLKALTIIG